MAGGDDVRTIIRYAAPGIERCIDLSGGLGKTDFNKIYVADGLGPMDDSIVELHELCHIWLRHNERCRAMKPKNFLLWNIACDLEIARHCYDAAIVGHMALRTSVTHTGVRKEDADKYPGCQYAEEYYRELEREQDALQGLADRVWRDLDKDGINNETGSASVPIDPQDLIKSLADRLRSRADKNKATAVQNKTKAHLESQPKPSICSEIDRFLGRYRTVGMSSYRKPPRYATSGFLRKGKKLMPKRPRVAIYVDRSGSFTPDKTAMAESALSTLLARYGSSVTHDTLEFSNDVGINISHGHGTNYGAVHESISRDRPKLAIVVTDDDNCPPLKTCQDTRVIVVPIGCSSTSVAKNWDGAVEVQI
jgi:predicted metal-dependent peptidase